VGLQLEDEAQRQEQMVIDQQIARDCQLAFDLDSQVYKTERESARARKRQRERDRERERE
jgi:hypothetical protein